MNSLLLFRSSVYSTRSEEDPRDRTVSACVKDNQIVEDSLIKAIHPLLESNQETQKQLTALRVELKRITQNQSDAGLLSVRDGVLVAIVVLVQLILQWLWKR